MLEEKMNSRSFFFYNFLKNPAQVAAIMPSSRHVVRKIGENIDFNNAATIVEYGPGTGSVTKAILQEMKQNAKLICFEANKEFCSFLSKNIKDPRLIIVNDSAENLGTHLEKLNVGNVDYILSGIPFSLIKKHAKKTIIKKTKDVLRQNGKFIVYQQYNGHMEKYLNYFKVSRHIVFMNLPPTFIFVCEKT